MPDDDQLWPQDESPDAHGVSFAPPSARTRAAGRSGSASPFPDRDVMTEAPTSGRTATITRRTIAAGGLASVAFLAACNTPGLRQIAGGRFRPNQAAPVAGGVAPTATPSASASATAVPSASAPVAPLPTMSGTMNSAPAATATATAGATVAPPPTGAPAPAPTPPAPVPPGPSGPATPELLAGRATYGPTAALLTALRQNGNGAWLDQQLNPGALADPAGDAVRAAYPDVARPYSQQRAQDLNKGQLIDRLQDRALALATWSNRQLFEVMVDFWNNHVGVAPRGDDRLERTRADYDNTVVRANAMGNFLDMLRASGMHPAMMRYLNLDGSHKDNPNENYAREVLELYSVGVDGGYTEADVEQLALGLTGWRTRSREDGMEPYFDGGRHFVGPFTVMGRAFANPSADSGPAVWQEVSEFLATHPSTARYIAMKLVRHFVADDTAPYEALIARLAEVYLANGTAIAPVLRELFTSGEFGGSAGLKARRPYERYVAMLRLLSPQPPGNIVEAADRLRDRLPAQDPLGWYPPDGYPDVISEWASAGTALSLFNVGHRLLRKDPGDAGLVGADPIVAAGPTTHTEAAIEAARFLLLRDPTDTEIDAVVTVLASGNIPEALGNDDARRRAAVVAGTVLLSSPAHLLR